MSSLHPHWQPTGLSTSANAQKNNTVPVQGKSVSRRPAAIVGIGLVIGIFVFFVQGVQYLTGQLVQEMTINVLEDGTFDPSSVTVNPGSTIVFVNSVDAFMIIRSDSLCDTEGNCLEKTILPGETTRYSVPVQAEQDIPHNVYDSLVGGENSTPLLQITVSGPAVRPEEGIGGDISEDIPDDILDSVLQDLEGTAPESTENPFPDDPLVLDEEQASSAAPQNEDEEGETPPSSASTSASTTSSSSTTTSSSSRSSVAIQDEEDDEIPAPPVASVVELPRNPYTVGSTYIPPSPTGIPTQNTDNTLPADTELHGGAPLPPIQGHKPISQPETGMGTWLLALSAAAGMWLLWRSTRYSAAVVTDRL